MTWIHPLNARHPSREHGAHHAKPHKCTAHSVYFQRRRRGVITQTDSLTVTLTQTDRHIDRDTQWAEMRGAYTRLEAAVTVGAYTRSVPDVGAYTLGQYRTSLSTHRAPYAR
eukprot:3540211-Rhodomonas_salina.2